MQALFVATLILVALVVLVPMMFMVGALFRTVVATFRPRESGRSGGDTVGDTDGHGRSPTP